MHTHLFGPKFRDLNIWGIDELLTYHYLIAEYLRAEPTPPQEFLALPKEIQADRIWDALFVRRTPLSEATSGVIKVLTAFELIPSAPDLREARAFFSSRRATPHINDIMKKSGVTALVMTNDPLDPAERAFWDANVEQDARFLAALRIDPVLNGGTVGMEKLAADGYDSKSDPAGAFRKFLETWIAKMKPKYMAVSLPDDFMYPDDSHRSMLLRDAVLPVCKAHNLPFAMMIGVRRAVNPALQSAGDGMGIADLRALENLASENPEVRFMVTTLAQENAHSLCVVARKFANVLPFGCWWFMNNPSIVERTTLMRLEMLGPTFVPQHSDARIFDQLIYKWQHARRAVASALVTRYEEIEASGMTVLRTHIKRDAQALMGGIAGEWLGIS